MCLQSVFFVFSVFMSFVCVSVECDSGASGVCEFLTCVPGLCFSAACVWCVCLAVCSVCIYGVIKVSCV